MGILRECVNVRLSCVFDALAGEHFEIYHIRSLRMVAREKRVYCGTFGRACSLRNYNRS